ncbi:reverse transcriptase domain-containing protein [uncultured Microscilla sp.]|uniref:reverse transcriptase domain-containing protein n=1 Tax=uncultured Microscilla sp. TaxID=432653 RepID=UPI00261AF91F|nr:reverse transcriptase domain-containing protein [uncultured Microscilla sp.]
MTYKEYETLFRHKAQNVGYSEDDIKSHLDYAKPLIEKGLPVIYNTSHLSSLVGYTRNYLKRVVSPRTPHFYRTFKVKKKDRGYRVITEPLPSLKEIQHWILENILYKVPVSKFSKAYTPNKSILDSVKWHKGKKKILTLDIENFFPSITLDETDKIFKNLGYSPIVSGLLSKLCCLQGQLPTGAPTSPYLSNIFLQSFDDKVASYCNSKEPKVRYTRYADDLTFSANEFDENELINFIEVTLAGHSLKLNESKTRLMLSSQRQITLGLVVNEKIQAPKEKRKELRQAVYYIKKFGLKDHLRKINCQKQNYLRHLLGTARFILFIDPNNKEVLGYKESIEKWIANENMRVLKESLDKVIGNPDEWQSDFAEITTIAPQGVLCLLSAASYYDLTTFIPSMHYIAIEKSSNIIKPAYPPLEVFYWEGDNYTLGKIKINIEDTDIQIFDIEKTVCDAIKYKREIGNELAIEILKNYLKRQDRDISKLTDYATKLSIENQMKILLNTLLV